MMGNFVTACSDAAENPEKYRSFVSRIAGKKSFLDGFYIDESRAKFEGGGGGESVGH